MVRIVSMATRMLALPALAIGCASCVGLETLDDILAPGGIYAREVRGEVRSVDTRRQEIRIETGWGRTDRVQYDGRTSVIYRRRRYSVRDLERGDLVRMWVDDRSRRGVYTSRIEVEQSVRERYGRSGPVLRLERFEGSVARVDTRLGTFELRPSRGPVIMVVLPRELDRSTDNRFRKLRRGDRIRFEGYPLSATRIELRRFL